MNEKLFCLHHNQLQQNYTLHWMTNELIRRMYEHRNELVRGFSKKYQIKYLVYFEETSDVIAAIQREKQLKK